VNDALKDASFVVLRSLTGAGNWVPLNETPMLYARSFTDETFSIRDLTLQPHYQVVAQLPGIEPVLSPVIGPFTHLSPPQFGAVRQMINRELQRMQFNGTPIWHFIPLTSGEPSLEFDANTWQQLAVEKPDPKDPSFGLPFKGGYAAPFQTYMEAGQKTVTETDRPDGSGTEQKITMEARMPAFPIPARGHMLAHPATDDRWVIDSIVEPFLFRGVAAVAHKAKLLLLMRSDPRYRVTLPFAAFPQPSRR
jgi:hypothetical protein